MENEADQNPSKMMRSERAAKSRPRENLVTSRPLGKCGRIEAEGKQGNLNYENAPRPGRLENGTKLAKASQNLQDTILRPRARRPMAGRGEREPADGKGGGPTAGPNRRAWTAGGRKVAEGRRCRRRSRREAGGGKTTAGADRDLQRSGGKDRRRDGPSHRHAARRGMPHAAKARPTP